MPIKTTSTYKGIRLLYALLVFVSLYICIILSSSFNNFVTLRQHRSINYTKCKATTQNKSIYHYLIWSTHYTECCPLRRMGPKYYLQNPPCIKIIAPIGFTLVTFHQDIIMSHTLNCANSQDNVNFIDGFQIFQLKNKLPGFQLNWNFACFCAIFLEPWY